MWCCMPFCKTTTEMVSGSEGITFHADDSPYLYPPQFHCRCCSDIEAVHLLLASSEMNVCTCAMCRSQTKQITIQHIKSISRVKHKLKSDIMENFLDPDQFDVYIAHSDTDTQTELDATAEAVAMKHDESHSNLVDAVQCLPTAVTSADSNADSCNASFAYKEEYLSDDSNPSEVKQMSFPPTTTTSLCETTAETMAPVKQEITFACTTCLEEFADEDVYIHHTLMHTKGIGNPDEDSVADCSPSSAVLLPAGLVTNRENEVHPTDTNDELDILVLKNDEQKQEDLMTPQMNILQPDKSLAELSNHINFETTRAYEIFSLKQIISDFGDIETKTTSESQQNQFVCDVCQKIFKRKNCLIKHVKSHNFVKILLTCKFCKYQCKDVSMLVKHTRTHTGVKPYVCIFCDYKCNQNSNLVRHLRSHTGEKPYACKVCDFKCRDNSGLMRHMKTHTGEKPYACKYCNYKSAYKNCFSRHMRSHTGEKPFVCKKCNYKCTDQSSLVKHVRAHTGEKPFVCKFCDFKSTQSCSLVHHVMRIHPGEKAFVCTFCDYKCNQKGRLKTHMKNHPVQH